MKKLIRCLLVVMVALVVARHGTAHAQAFPPDSEWVPLLCERVPMSDFYQDEPGALDERDIVGGNAAAAGLRASDESFLYLRLRLDQDPAPAGELRPFAWGMEIDLDGVLSTYELLLLVDGIGGGGGSVLLSTNRTTTLANDPNDPADLPAVMSYPFATHGRTLAADGSSYGSDSDYFLDFAFPWTDLIPLGLDRDSRIVVWAGSSSTSQSLDGDFACHDGRSGEPTLDGVASDPTAGDPVVDTDGDGFTDAEEIEAGSDPLDPNSVPESRLEGGGGGCSAGGGALGMATLLLALGVARRRKRR